MSTKLRIAVVAACPFPYGRGTPIRIRRLAEGLAARGHEVHVATYHLGDREEVAGVRIHRIAPVPGYTRSDPGPSLRKLLVVDTLLVARFRRLLSERAFDVIHAHHAEGLLVALLARPGHRLPIIFDSHTTLESELPYYCGPALLRRLTRQLGRMFDRFLPARADHTIAVTTELRARLLASGSIDPGRISVVGNGLEFEVFERARRRAGTTSRGQTLVFTGNLALYQGVDLMLAAFARVRERRPSVRLSIVSQSAFAPFEAMACELGIRDALDVVETGFERVPEHLAHADVALNPRLDSPGIAQKTLNYMAMGLPIVSFIGSGRHLIDGDTGLLVENGDIEGFADAILRLLEDPELAHRLGEQGKRMILKKNDWTQSSALLERVLEQVVAGPAGKQMRSSQDVPAI
jgi:glycosyltransferase involved in cell wall biosynthesis